MTWFKETTPGAENCPVVSFGGSYGGMLAAWFRVKYPWVTDGAISASAPILEFAGVPGYSQWSFNEIITDDFAQTQFGGSTCSDTLRKGFVEVMRLGKTEAGRAELAKTFRPCRTISTQADVDAIYAWLSNGFAYEAMADYPYPANFLEPMPGYPINVSCSEAMKFKSNPVQALMAAVSVYYNYTGEAGPCSNLSKYSTGALGMLSWDYQACTEMAFPISSNGTSDMFLPSYFDEAAYAAGCKKQFGVQTRPRWMPLQFGAAQLSSGISNIVFSNGVLDPWRGGGVTKTLSDSVVAVVIEGGAHHLDMRTPNPLDPESVVKARELEEEHIRRWCAPKMSL
jgi:lysosomal Pro-X carboxypeptidase